MTKCFLLRQGDFSLAEKPHYFSDHYKKHLILGIRARAKSRLALKRRLHLRSCEVLVRRLLQDTKKLERKPKD